jgi:hypothetical protein
MAVECLLEMHSFMGFYIICQTVVSEFFMFGAECMWCKYDRSSMSYDMFVSVKL